MEHTTLLNNEVSFLNIVEHRNINNCYEYLFKILSDIELDLGDDEIHVHSKEYVEEGSELIYYYIWIKDITSFLNYSVLFLEDHLDTNLDEFENKIMFEIYNYCKREDIKILYCFVYKLIPPEDFSDFLGKDINDLCETNYKEQLRSVEHLRKMYPTHKIICNDPYAEYVDDYPIKNTDVSFALKMMKKNDVLFTFNHGSQIMREKDIVFFKRRIENVFTGLIEKRNINRLNTRFSIKRVIEETRDYIEILDYEAYLRKASVDTIVQVCDDRMSKDSALKVLPKHLVREICRWV